MVQRRSGFTLLEMILALLIGVVLMYSLYGVLTMQVQQAQNGRLTLHEGTLARSILTRMTSDILGNLQAVNPMYIPGSSLASSAAPAATPATTTANGTTTGSTTPSTTDTTTTETNSTIAFNTGLYGTTNSLILCVSKVPRELNLTGVLGSGGRADPTQQVTACDLRRISYWMVSGTGNSAGLARQELMQATSNDLNTTPPDVPDAPSYIIAPEVKDITFQYFDGANWQDFWDGTTLGGPTGETPIGPPSAIAITLTFNRRAPDNTDLPDDQLPKYKHVVAIPAGNNFPQTATSN